MNSIKYFLKQGTKIKLTLPKLLSDSRFREAAFASLKAHFETRQRGEPHHNLIDPDSQNWNLSTDLFLGLLVVLMFLLSVGAPMAWAGPKLVSSIFVFYFSGFCFIPGILLNLDRPEVNAGSAAKIILLAIGSGMTLAFCLWFSCAYIFKNYFPGTLCLLFFAVAGLIRMRRSPGFLLEFFKFPPALAISAFSLFLGCYIYGVNEIQIGNQLFYTYRWDWDAHLFFASLAREAGLPMIRPDGLADVPFSSVTHVGYSVFLGGMEQLTQTSLFQVARFLGILGFLLISISALALVSRLIFSYYGQFLASISPLIWGGLVLPLAIYCKNVDAIFDPYYQGVIKGTMVSGGMYHNGTQLLAVAVSSLALVALDVYCRKRDLQLLTLASLLIVFSGLTKPSTFIVLGPALTLIMGIKRERFQAWVIVLVIFFVGIIAYMLPAILLDVNSMNCPWEARWTELLDTDKVFRKIMTFGIACPVMAYWACDFFRNVTKPRKWNWYDVQTIALAGGIVFSIVFSEVGRSSHGNSSWSFKGATIPLAALWVACLWKFCFENEPSWKRTIWFCTTRTLVVILLTCHLLGGLFYACYYPTIGQRNLAVNKMKVLVRARAITEPNTTFLIDPSLDNRSDRSAGAYLARPALWTWMAIYTIKERRTEKKRWLQICEEKSVDQIDDFLSTRDAIILGNMTFFLRDRLTQLGWTGQTLDDVEMYELWLRPKR